MLGSAHIPIGRGYDKSPPEVPRQSVRSTGARVPEAFGTREITLQWVVGAWGWMVSKSPEPSHNTPPQHSVQPPQTLEQRYTDRGLVPH
ncbi:uncharacterized protein METZ01_LOCUS423960 [marine metagenome]|uniref:Uncharacterized protein n=1 Tax=marine metagenome TaxID=408172 RepID=A0A382XIX9_9ZZZZ